MLPQHLPQHHATRKGEGKNERVRCTAEPDALEGLPGEHVLCLKFTWLSGRTVPHVSEVACGHDVSRIGATGAHLCRFRHMTTAPGPKATISGDQDISQSVSSPAA